MALCMTRHSQARRFVFGVVCVLLLSFSLHSIQIPHMHSNHAHEHARTTTTHLTLLGEFMHAADKKVSGIFFLLVVSFFTFLETLSLHVRIVSVHTVPERTLCLLASTQKLFDFIRISLRRGIVHSKIFTVS